MNQLLNAAMKERELIASEIDFLKELVEDPTFPEQDRIQSDLRMQAHQFYLQTMDGIIARQLDKEPINNLMSEVNDILNNHDH